MKTEFNQETKVSEVLKELEREQALRKRFYPSFIKKGKLYKSQAEKQQNNLNAAIAVFQNFNQDLFISQVLKSLKNENKQQSLF